MIKRYFYIFIFAGMASGGSISCSSDIPDCPSKMCVMSGGWVLTEATADDVNQNSDLSKFRLILNQPNPNTATTSDFNRTQTSGNQDVGTWSIENNETILRLVPNNDPAAAENWIIESFTPRELVLIMNRDSNKEGPSKIRFTLEPF
jgi:hypothetical protein